MLFVYAFRFLALPSMTNLPFVCLTNLLLSAFWLTSDKNYCLSVCVPVCVCWCCCAYLCVLVCALYLAQLIFHLLLSQLEIHAETDSVDS